MKIYERLIWPRPPGLAMEEVGRELGGDGCAGAGVAKPRSTWASGYAAAAAADRWHRQLGAHRRPDWHGDRRRCVGAGPGFAELSPGLQRPKRPARIGGGGPRDRCRSVGCELLSRPRPGRQSQMRLM